MSTTFTLVRESHPLEAATSVRSGFHPATDPQEIARQHAREVSEAVRSLGTLDPAILSERLYLPLWNVSRALVSLGLVEPPPPREMKSNTRVTAISRIVAIMSKGGSFTSRELATALEVGDNHVRTVLDAYASWFVRIESRGVLRAPGERGWIRWELKLEHRVKPS